MIKVGLINNHVHKRMVIQSPCMKSHQIRALEICIPKFA